MKRVLFMAIFSLLLYKAQGIDQSVCKSRNLSYNPDDRSCCPFGQSYHKPPPGASKGGCCKQGLLFGITGCCSKDKFNSDTNTCCPIGTSYVAEGKVCCASGTYNPDTKKCCPEGELFTGKPGSGGCCKSGTSYSAEGKVCCAQGTYDPDTKKCCPEGELFTGKPGSGGCCKAGMVYASGGCCPKGEIYASSSKKCCKEDNTIRNQRRVVVLVLTMRLASAVLRAFL